MNKANLKIGQTLQIELVLDGFVEGDLILVSSERDCIRLCNVRDLATDEQLGYQFYYSSEIRKIDILKEAPEPTADASLTNAQSQPAFTAKQLSNDVLDCALNKIEKCIFINQIDAGYQDAIDHLQDQRKFGVFIECIADPERNSKVPSLLSFVTYDRIYIFDIKSLEMTADVSSLLSTDRYIRAIHDGRLMQNVLQHSYGTVLGRCVDIKVAVIAIETVEGEGKVDEDSAIHLDNSLAYCVEKYLKLPDKFFCENVNFGERPLKTESKLAAAKNVALLLDLHDHIVHEILLERFYISCDMYADSLAQLTDFVESRAVLCNGHMKDALEVSPFSLPTDVELVKSPTSWQMQ